MTTLKVSLIEKWEILDEVGTLVQSNYRYCWCQSGCTIRDPNYWNGKTGVFFIDAQKIKVDQNCYIDLLKTYLLPECRRAMILNSCKTVSSHRAKVTQQFLRENIPDFIAADEWASYSPDLNPLDYYIWGILQDLVYEGRWLPFANLQDLKEAIKNNDRRSPLRQCENPLHNAKRLNAVRKQNGGAIQHIFR